MNTRPLKLIVATAAVGAIIAGGVAQAQSSAHHTRAASAGQATAATASDIVENGAVDVIAQASSTSADGDQVQQGDQTTPDTGSQAADQVDSGSAADTASQAADQQDTASIEAAGSELPANDGPGGHADEPANPPADTQQQGKH